MRSLLGLCQQICLPSFSHFLCSLLYLLLCFFQNCFFKIWFDPFGFNMRRGEEGNKPAIWLFSKPFSYIEYFCFSKGSLSRQSALIFQQLASNGAYSWTLFRNFYFLFWKIFIVRESRWSCSIGKKLNIFCCRPVVNCLKRAFVNCKRNW